MNINNILKTILSKTGILIANFLLVILSTHFWGAEGRGTISILIADMAIIGILNNVFGGSSVSYYTPKVGINKLFMPSYIWIIIITPSAALLINQLQNHGNFFFLTTLAILSSMFSVHLNFFAGKENFKLYNIYNLLLPCFTLISVLFFVFLIGLKSVNSYFYGFLISIILVWLLSFLKVSPHLSNFLGISNQVIKKVFNYGWQTELSYLLQFLNYRLSYYFILYYKGISSVGIFSVGILLAESIWIISRSIAVVQYSQIINKKVNTNEIEITKNAATLSFLASFAAVLILILLPSEFYGIVFGTKFTSVKEIMIILFPGILFNAFSNIHAHYFSATGKTKILIIKSLSGLIVTVGLSLLLIPKWGIIGACFTTISSYFVSSAFLLITFYRNIPFKMGDFSIKFRDLFNSKS